MNSDVEICEGQTAQLQASGTSNYLWINNTAGLSNTGIANPVSRAVATTEYMVTGSDSYKCFSDTATVTVIVHPLPTVDAGNDVEALSGTAIQLGAMGSANIVRWKWTPASALSCDTGGEPSMVWTLQLETIRITSICNALQADLSSKKAILYSSDRLSPHCSMN